jgi:SNF2 family DNA or RNA helicase
LDRLLEYVEEGIQSGQRMVIFSQFTSMLKIIKCSFDEKSWSYHSLDGQTPPKERVEMAERFNNGEKSLFLISLKAGGTGLNLIGGDTVILYDTWWNPAIEEQAADRVYRYGQTKTVQVIKLIANGTIEEKILDLHEKKKALVDAIIQPGEETLQSLSAEDIKRLLAFS